MKTFPLSNWDADVSELVADGATRALEEGDVLFLPRLCFALQEREKHLLSPQYANGRAKNISFDGKTGSLRGAVCPAEVLSLLKLLLGRFAVQSKSLVEKLCPGYQGKLESGRTSYRPAEIQGRASSYRKDDTRLHVDAFPSSPVQNRRILRVFTNINPHGQDRLWHVGAPFEQVARTFLRRSRRPFWGEAWALQALRLTRSRRTMYDHYMLQLHDLMKGDERYQCGVEHTPISFPPGSTWIVFTDQVSHAALTGQYALEQTFYLPVEAMADPALSPLRILERFCGSALA